MYDILNKLPLPAAVSQAGLLSHLVFRVIMFQNEQLFVLLVPLSDYLEFESQILRE